MYACVYKCMHAYRPATMITCHKLRQLIPKIIPGNICGMICPHRAVQRIAMHLFMYVFVYHIRPYKPFKCLQFNYACTCVCVYVSAFIYVCVRARLCMRVYV